MQKDEFYIGWMQNAPVSFGRFIKKYLLFLSIAVIVIASILALRQKQFSTANFEFGKTTIVKGVYNSGPVPHLLVKQENELTMIPLVGYGKHGAKGVMDDLAREQNASLEAKELSLKGTLFYGDGKILMQIDQNDQPLESISQRETSSIQQESGAEAVILKGEIIDPKCYFGVMKPGEGKVHKDCAIRCILGGIPPVLKLTNEKGENDYVLLTSMKENINEKVKDFVATPSQVQGYLKKYAGWSVIEVGSIQNISKQELNKLPTAGCESGCCKK
jgi:hypothetical protein